jgi:DNA-binding NtrC family response regulator
MQAFNETQSSYSKRILVIEDDLFQATTVCQIVRAVVPEAEIEWITTAEEALVKILGGAVTEARHYDLVLADIFLDGKTTGIELWEACQKSQPDMPVLLMSGMALTDFFRTVGRDIVSPPFLPKPFSVGECGQIIDNLLRRGKSGGGYGV